MSIRTKIITVPTILAILAVVGVYQYARSDDSYTLSVKWQPGVLSIQNPVRITVVVDGYPLINRVRHVSPWGETMTAPTGAPIVLTAVSDHSGIEFMDCIILRNGRSVPRTGYDSIKGPGNVRCRG